MATARGFLGAGDLYIARFNPATGVFGSYAGPYEVTRFEIQPNVEVREMTSRGRSTYGQVIESVSIPQPADFALTMPEINKESLLLALMGEEAAINQGAGTWADVTVVVPQKGEWIDLGQQNVTAAGFSLRNANGTVTYVLGTDFEINYRMGWLRVLPASVIANGASLRVTGAFGAVGGTRIRGAVQSQIRARLRLDGINFVDQAPVMVDVFEAVIAADSAFDFLSDEFAELSLSGRLKTPVGRTEPFEVQLLNPAG